MAELTAQAARAWQRIADAAHWAEPFTELHETAAPFDRWFVDGRLNVSVNCLDRHLPERADQTALLWEGEPGDRRELTYAELHQDVLSLAGSLRAHGIEPGDRVALHLGWVPETAVIMLACARVGAVYTVLPVPLPVEGLAQRIEDFRPRIVFTQDGAWRRGAIQPSKARADEALSAAHTVELTVVVRRTGQDVPWYEGDRWYHDFISDRRPGAPAPDAAPAPLPTDHPLSMEPVASRRGRPVWVTHAGCRQLLSAAVVHRHGACAPGVSWVAGDPSWIVTQTSGVLAPLFWGDTTVMYEGALDTPGYDRIWQIIARYGVVNVLMTPSTARRLHESTPEPPSEESIATLQRIATLGERADPSTLEWFTTVIGRGRVTVADGWGQIQLGGVVRYDDPVDAAGLPDPGLELVDDAGRPAEPGAVGEVVLTSPWAGTVAAVEGVAADDLVDTHWSRIAGVYATGDLARYEDGVLQFLGRRDEVVSVTGQLVSLTEIREVLQEQPFVSAVEVFEAAHPTLRTAVMAAVVLDPTQVSGLDVEQVVSDLLDEVRDVLGGLARPRRVVILDRFGDELGQEPRRRVLGAIIAASPENRIRQVSWQQVLAAAGFSQG